jgi:hypothetical protein
MGDQPSNATYLEHGLDVAFQFVETRTEPQGLKPIRARGDFKATGTVEAFRAEVDQVLKDTKGEAGTRKRANAKKVQGELAASWAEGGPAKIAFEEMCTRYGL